MTTMTWCNRAKSCVTILRMIFNSTATAASDESEKCGMMLKYLKGTMGSRRVFSTCVLVRVVHEMFSSEK